MMEFNEEVSKLQQLEDTLYSKGDLDGAQALGTAIWAMKRLEQVFVTENLHWELDQLGNLKKAMMMAQASTGMRPDGFDIREGVSFVRLKVTRVQSLDWMCAFFTSLGQISN